MFGRKSDCIFVPHRDGSIVMIEAKKAVHITSCQSRLLDKLLEASPDPVLCETLYDVLWPAKVLPDDPRGALGARMSGLRDALKGTPCSVETTLGGYKLVGPMKHERFWSTDD